ncbi:hypothetical protein BST97_02390 [Nonlabens spongiae]|uniref:FAD-dependent urate hydroxylase HpyO/Asp monooxygenase CreE-like FAD/NAD(P)-binding domain-containing protein n=1 Tax=Nonlabens spongiae TaxID=331648 RepID=A0A1W6MH69_9FLAO|nr:FAD/NAD(P)-binding protein [Nonlabens spongiae]ARN76938.1 hypothetical protein BST97_02390 [Nonlabens spongiae]
MDTTFNLAIVGFGPRGLYVLEQYFLKHSEKEIEELPKVLIFEKDEELAVGKAWSVHQPDANWINIADRALMSFPARPAMQLGNLTIPEFQGYTSWLQEVMGHDMSDVKDTFHRRKIMGAYLTQRCTQFIESLKDLEVIKIIQERVVGLDKNHTDFLLYTPQKKYFSNKVMLTQGHLPTEMSDENKKFKQHANRDGIYFSANCYSQEAMDIYAFAKAENSNSNSTSSAELDQKNTRTTSNSKDPSKAIGIKGLGLSMIDVVRMILEHDGGHFEKLDGSYHLKYVGGDREISIIPYSLDGLPLVPKPLGKHIDDPFSIPEADQSALFETLKHLRDQKNTEIGDLLKPLADVMAQVYLSLNTTFCDQPLDNKGCTEIIAAWLEDPDVSHDHILSKELPITEYIQTTCGMAMGDTPPSLDFAVGQMWRQLQPDLYNIFSYKTRPDLLNDFIKVDEQTKRYSYGPPVESMLQLLALEKAGILNLDYVTDPEIKLIADGFKIVSSDKSTTVHALIDAIQASPDVKETSDLLTNDLLNKNLGQQVSEKLAFHVDQDCTHIVNERRVEGLYSFSRLTKGSIYGVDAILECFNEEKIKGWLESL